MQIELLGGVRIDTLDRMRVTIKVSVTNRRHPQYVGETADLAVRHNLDLYNDTQVEKFVRRVAERLEVGSIAVTKAIAEITGQLEVYRLEQLDKKDIKREKVLSPYEREQAIQFLEQPKLLERTNELIGKSGVVGEEINRLLMYLIFTSRKREYPLHCISLGSSGAGKTHLQEKVGELMPDEDKIEITVLSENAFYYFGQRELKHKLLFYSPQSVLPKNKKPSLFTADVSRQRTPRSGCCTFLSDTQQGCKNTSVDEQFHNIYLFVDE